MNNNSVVEQEDIEYAEKILFNKTGVFDKEERLPIINNFNESFDVNACPGSGKTTVLLAKLIILSRKMPLKNGQGICVLTHTNVAINEIKNKLGDKSDILFKYPNYFGTIQSFIDTYLAIPYFKRQMGKNIKSIDNDLYRNHILKLSTGNYPNLWRTITYCESKMIGGYRPGQYKQDLINFIVNKHYKFINDKQVICNGSGASLELKSYYKDLYKIMFDYSFAEGILRYEDAYVLANQYLSRFNELKSFFSERFKYVFIDEMQDTKEQQEKLLEKIFDRNKVIIQRYGDINQNIGISNNEKCGWILSKNVKYINSSKRYGETMIKFIEPLRINRESKLKGNSSIKTLHPHIIIFNKDNINCVIDKFTDIIGYYGIDKTRGKIKVIGKVGMKASNQYLTIKSYTDKFNKSDKRDTFSEKLLFKLNNSENLKSFYNTLLTASILSLDDSGKTVSVDSFKRYMESENIIEFIQYRANIKKWFIDIKNNQKNVIDNIILVTSNLFSKLSKYNFDRKILEENIINNDKNIIIREVASSNEIKDRKNISDINTVFGVKGETHIATLYLESKYINNYGQDRSDISRILEYMIGKNETVLSEDREALISAYVAMSRAQKLTCIAISYDTIKGRIKEFKDFGYKIVACDKNIQVEIDKEINLEASKKLQLL